MYFDICFTIRYVIGSGAGVHQVSGQLHAQVPAVLVYRVGGELGRAASSPDAKVSYKFLISVYEIFHNFSPKIDLAYLVVFQLRSAL